MLLVAGGVRRDGDQVVLDDLQRDIAAAGLGERVRVTGFLEDADVPGPYRRLRPAGLSGDARRFVVLAGNGAGLRLCADRGIGRLRPSRGRRTQGGHCALSPARMQGRWRRRCAGCWTRLSSASRLMAEAHRLCRCDYLDRRRRADAASLPAGTARLATKTGDTGHEMTAERTQCIRPENWYRGTALAAMLLAWLLGCWQLGRTEYVGGRVVHQFQHRQELGRISAVGDSHRTPPAAALCPAQAVEHGWRAARNWRCVIYSVGHGGAGSGAHLCRGPPPAAARGSRGGSGAAAGRFALLAALRPHDPRVQPDDDALAGGDPAAAGSRYAAGAAGGRPMFWRRRR